MTPAHEIYNFSSPAKCGKLNRKTYPHNNVFQPDTNKGRRAIFKIKAYFFSL